MTVVGGNKQNMTKKARAELWLPNPDRDYFVNAMRYLDAVLFQFLEGISLISYKNCSRETANRDFKGKALPGWCTNPKKSDRVKMSQTFASSLAFKIPTFIIELGMPGCTHYALGATQMDNLPERMLRLMSDGAWYSTEELVEKISHRFSATIHVLSKRGYEFEKRPTGGRQYEYRLIIEPRVIA